MVYDFSFWAIFSLLTPPSPSPNRPKNKNLKKKKKKRLEISSFPFYTCVIHVDGYWNMVRDGQTETDGQKKWHINVDAPPKNQYNKSVLRNQCYWQTDGGTFIQSTLLQGGGAMTNIYMSAQLWDLTISF